MTPATPHAFYVGAAYGVTALVVAGLIVHAAWDLRAQRRRLSELEERGALRRSAAPDPDLDSAEGALETAGNAGARR